MANTFTTILDQAKEKHIAVGAVNIFNYLSARAAVEAARDLGVNLILQTSSGTVEHFGARQIFDIVDAARRDAGIMVALHLDHCRSTELGKLCVDTGWDAVMMDFSHLPLEENIARTLEVAQYAHAKGTAIEGEIGVISGVEEEITAAEEVKADYDETMEFVRRSRVDAIAPAIGTAHGVYHGVPVLNFDLVERLGKEDTRVVIHGGSGLSAEAFGKLIALGGCKINISTVVKNTYMGRIRELAAESPDAPIPFDTAVQKAVYEVVKSHLRVFSGLSTSF
ncbi:tagatose bisphosphate family class II aldolase [Selenomonas sp. TAMA-11512]|uniref:class II fructose-bisphosphate aldolase n=1 Tax=Selenomonas sp. TAMA-11512 TaxID=3095337 RepID=UPI003091A9CD|nr:tagatose bisphosphate family class II aldolase [Selenomonas sp. TAMA-11512]